MTEKEFVELHEHEFMGLLLDAMTSQAQGGERAMLVRHWTARIRVRLAAIYQQLQQLKAVPSANGQAGPLAGKEVRKP